MIPRQKRKKPQPPYRVSRLLGLLALLWSVSSCSPLFSRQPSMVLVLVDSLAEQEYLCTESPLFENLEDLRAECDRLIRFTHAFTPSPFLQAQIASLLSGLEPTQHGVRTNGPEAIPGELRTLAERAIGRRMRTAFFSGGVPLQNKFGLSQGYELFNDSFDQSNPSLFRPVSQSLSRALRWLDEEVEASPFHMVLYVPDLLVPAPFLTTEITEELGSSRQGRLRSIYASVDQLIGELKKRKRWNHTHFVFLGVGEQGAQLNPLNPLSSLTTQVPLQMKLAKGTKANLASLSQDLVSFAQVGTWLLALMEHQVRQGELVLQNKVARNEPIPQEWPVWSWLGISDWTWLGLRSKPSLFTFFREVQAYESLTDRSEVEALPGNESTRLIGSLDLEALLNLNFPRDCHVLLDEARRTNLNCGLQPALNTQVLEQVTELHGLVLRAETESPLQELARTDKKGGRPSPIVSGWLAVQALKARDWSALFELGRMADQSAWTLVAQLNLREPTSNQVPGCLRYFQNLELSTAHFYQVCQDTELRKIVDGLDHLRRKSRPSESFWAQLSSINQMRRAKMINVHMLYKNDIQNFQRLAPSLAELYFFLPENLEFLDLLDLDKV